MSKPLELELEVAMSHPVGAGYHTWASAKVAHALNGRVIVSSHSRFFEERSHYVALTNLGIAEIHLSLSPSTGIWFILLVHSQHPLRGS